MTDREIEKLIRKLTQGFDDLNVLYIKKVAEQIKKLGGLNPTSLHRLSVMSEMNDDIVTINRILEQTVEMAAQQVKMLYKKAVEDMYEDPRFERAIEETPLSEKQKQKLERYAQRVARQTQGSMMNLSNTTAIRTDYQKVVDKAILTVTSGLGDYQTAMRDSIREIGGQGVRIEYESGHHRRLDSAIRQNILDGTKQIEQNASIMMGEMLGYDAYEISAHARSAPDHEPVQGRVFLIEEFEKLQNGDDCVDVNGKKYKGFPRAIGQWNCMHIVMSFSTEYSKPRYTEEQLQKFEEDNARGCYIDGKHYTTYEAGQMMRRIEAEIRRLKDTAIAAREAGDKDLQRECQERINALSKRYTKVSKASGIKPRRDRMRVEGFRKK